MRTDRQLKPHDSTTGLVEAIISQIWVQVFLPPLFVKEFRVLHQTVLKGGHLKLTLDLQGYRFNGIFFRRSAEVGSVARLAYRPEINEWMGQRSIQLVIEQVEG